MPCVHNLNEQRRNTMSILNEISENLQRGKAKIVKELVHQAIDAGMDPQEILGGLLSGMDVVGEKFKNGDVYIPEVLVAARAMNQGAALLKPLLAEAGAVACNNAYYTLFLSFCQPLFHLFFNLFSLKFY